MARDAGTEGHDGESRAGSAAGQLAREVSALQATLLGKLREEMPDADVDAFAGAAQRLAEAFGSVTAAAVDPLVLERARGARRAARAVRRQARPPAPASARTPGDTRRASTGPGTCGAGSTS